MQLQDRSFLITGGASGLGAACCRELVTAGARVTIVDMDENGAENLLAECPTGVRFIRTDVCDPEQMKAAIDSCVEWHGPLHGVITCAGILRGARVVGRQSPHDLELFRQVVDVNLIGTFNAVRLGATAIADSPLEQENERGIILMTASIAAWEGQIGQAAYSAAKGGVASMTLPMARELGQHGIRVVSIAPGIFDTPMMQAVSPELRKSLEAQIPYPPRFGRPDEFAQLARQIIENRMINGTVLRLDAGIRMQAK